MMNKNLLTILFLASTFTLFGQWNVYDGSALPTDSSPAFDGSCNEPGTDFSANIIADPDVTGNNLLEYLSPDVGGRQAYKVTPDAWTGFTAVVRMKAFPGVDTLDHLFDIEIRNGDSGLREKLFVKYNNTIELDNADTSAIVDVQEWRVYRITMSNDTVAVYIDENSTPILTGITTNSTSAYELKIADCSGSNSEGALVDWFTWTGDGAFAPGTGPALPDSLLVEGPWKLYAANVLPKDNSPEFDDSCNEPGANFSESIIADPDIPGNNLLDYLSPDLDGRQAYKVIPEAWTGFTAVMRVKGYPGIDTLDRLFDIEIRNGDSGLREKLYIGYDNTIELDNADTSATFDVMGWHIYRITMTGGDIAVYIDENSSPILTGVTTNSTSSYELKIADCSGATEGAILDWLIWTGEGAFAPETGPALPSSLSTDFTTGTIDVVNASTFALKTFPNPFSEVTNFAFELEQSGDVELAIFDLMGRRIQTLIDAKLPSGEHQVQYSTEHLPTGVYVYRFVSNGAMVANKIIKESK